MKQSEELRSKAMCRDQNRGCLLGQNNDRNFGLGNMKEDGGQEGKMKRKTE